MNTLPALLLIAACGGSAPRPTTPLVVTTDQLTYPNQPGHPPYVRPSVLKPHQIAGDTRITPEGAELDAAHTTGARLVGSFKFCLDTEGSVASVRMLQSTQAPNYDAEIIRTMEKWKFTPVHLDGTPIAVCSATTFMFTAR